MCSSKSSHLLQYRVGLHDQMFRTGHYDQNKIGRLSWLIRDLLEINHGLMDGPPTLDAKTAIKGAITVIRILNACNKNASQSFLCDGVVDSNDIYALVIGGNSLYQANRDLLNQADARFLKVVVDASMEMLAIYVRQFWARDQDLQKAIVDQLNEEAKDDLFQPFMSAEIDRMIANAKTILNHDT